jgi:hypothetical protein
VSNAVLMASAVLVDAICMRCQIESYNLYSMIRTLRRLYWRRMLLIELISMEFDEYITGYDYGLLEFEPSRWVPTFHRESLVPYSGQKCS